MERTVQKLKDLSRSPSPLDPDGTLIAVIELSLSSWLVAGEGRASDQTCPAFTSFITRARRAATGRAACELWGLCARPLAIEIGEGPPR
jgi:hypothetical protein